MRPGLPNAPPWPGCPRYLRVNTPRALDELQAMLGQGACHHSARRGVETAPCRSPGCRPVPLPGSSPTAASSSRGTPVPSWWPRSGRGASACASSTSAPVPAARPLHLAAMMQGKGRLLAMDVEEWKLENPAACCRAGASTTRRPGHHQQQDRQAPQGARGSVCCWTCPACLGASSAT